MIRIDKLKIAIHQPDFMPWLGFFAKMRKADVLIILDHTENNPRDAAFWGRRVKIIANRKPQWFSIPLVKDSGRLGVPIREMKINLTDKTFIEKNLRLIQENYKNTLYFSKVYPIIEYYFLMENDSLMERNMFFIKEIKEKLGIDTKLVYSSHLNPQGKSTSLLIDLIKKAAGKVYLSGDGAAGYMDMELFKNNQIQVEFNNYKSPVYNQLNTDIFIPGLTIFDAIMNIGFDKTSTLL